MGVLDELIGALALAGRYRDEARADPACAPGWLKMCAKHSARAEVLANQVPAMEWEDTAAGYFAMPSRHAGTLAWRGRTA